MKPRNQILLGGLITAAIIILCFTLASHPLILRNRGFVHLAKAYVAVNHETVAQTEWQSERAATLLQQVAEQPSTAPDSLALYIADAHFLQGKETEANQLWRALPEAEVMLLQRGHHKAAYQRYDMATRWYNAALEISDNPAWVWAAIAALRAERGETEATIEAVQQARQLATQQLPDSRLFHELALIVLRDIDPPAPALALELFDQALADNTYSSDFRQIYTLYWKGEAFRTMRRFKEAAATFRLILEEDPDHVGANGQLGRVLWLLHRKNADIETIEFHLKKAIELQPSNKAAYHWLRTMYKELGRQEEADEIYQQFLNKPPWREQSNTVINAHN